MPTPCAGGIGATMAVFWGDEDIGVQFFPPDFRESCGQSQSLEPAPWTPDPRGVVSPPDHTTLSETQFCKGQSLTWLSGGKTLPKAFMGCLSGSYYVPWPVLSSHTHHFLSSSERSLHVRYFYHIITHMETELQAVVGRSCEC